MNSSCIQPSILLVDDDVKFLRALARSLRTKDYSIITTSHPTSALTTLDTVEVAVALLDEYLPGSGTDGLALLTALKKKQSDIEVILITGDNSTSLVVQAIQAGATDFLTKPLDLVKLAQVLDQSIHRYQLRKQEDVALTKLPYREVKIQGIERERRYFTLLLQQRQHNLHEVSRITGIDRSNLRRRLHHLVFAILHPEKTP